MINMSRKDSKSKKELIVIIIVVVLIGVITAIILLNRDQDAFEYEGWIDCQPVLSPEKEDLCRRAEAAGYPYITY